LNAERRLVDRSDIADARAVLASVLPTTPVLHSRTLDALAGATVWFKAEMFQRTGSFKARGAYYHVHRRLAGSDPPATVVTASSGNHGQAVAWAAAAHGLSAHIVVPEGAAASKVAAAQAYGATVEFCGTTSRERLARAQELARQAGWWYVPPYDDPWVMAGQATVGLELLEQVPDVDTVVVPIGGGGLIAGIASAIKHENPAVEVVGVEPAGAAGAYLSRQAGRRVELPAGLSIADGLTTVVPGQLTFPVIEAAVDRLVTVTDEQIRATLWLLLSRLKVVVEPSGAAAAAAVLQADRPFQGRRAAVVLSGGNVDADRLAALLAPRA
jgi:threonine dehydratase